jgi:hypothetical protein
MRSYLEEKVTATVQKTENMSVGFCRSDHVTPPLYAKLSLSSPTIGGRSVGVVRSRTQVTEFFLV